MYQDSITGTLMMEKKLSEELDNPRVLKAIHSWLETEIKTIIHVPVEIKEISLATEKGIQKERFISSATIRNMLDKEMSDTILIKW